MDLPGPTAQQPMWEQEWMASAPDVPLGGFGMTQASEFRCNPRRGSRAGVGRETFLPPGRIGAPKINQAESWKNSSISCQLEFVVCLSPLLVIWGI